MIIRILYAVLVISAAAVVAVAAAVFMRVHKHLRQPAAPASAKPKTAVKVSRKR